MDEVLRDIGVGLAVLFLGFAAAVSATLEGVSRVFGWRAGHLWTWIRKAIDGEAPTTLSWLYSPLKVGRASAGAPKTSEFERSIRKTLNLDSKRINNIPGKEFARGVAHALVPGASEPPSFAEVRNAVQSLGDVPLKKAILDFIEEAEDDWGAFVDRVGEWFDNQMKDLSALYRRNARWIAAALGLILAVLFNLNALDAFDVLKNDAALRAAGVQAGQDISEECEAEPAGELNTCVGEQADKLFSSHELVDWLGLFDDNDRDRRFQGGWWPILGIALSAGLISLGAPFWRDTIRSLTMRRRTPG